MNKIHGHELIRLIVQKERAMTLEEIEPEHTVRRRKTEDPQRQHKDLRPDRCQVHERQGA